MLRVFRAYAWGLVMGLGLCGLVPGCGPITYVSRVTFGASGELSQAKILKGDQLAPYEYTSADAYLRKAKELAGYARFQEANRFATRAGERARQAKDVATTRERRDELPVFIPDGSMYISPKGTVKRGKPSDAPQESDGERPPLGEIDNEKPTNLKKGAGAEDEAPTSQKGKGR